MNFVVFACIKPKLTSVRQKAQANRDLLTKLYIIND